MAGTPPAGHSRIVVKYVTELLDNASSSQISLSFWTFVNIFGLHKIRPRAALGNTASHFAVRVTGVQRRPGNSSELSKVFLEFIRVDVIQLCVPLSSRN